VRRKVVEICKTRLAELEGQSPGSKAGAAEAELAATLQQEKYWTRATLAESLVALGQDNAASALADTLKQAPAAWMADATRRQVDILQVLLKESRGTP
jgi:hypothetical protein